MNLYLVLPLLLLSIHHPVRVKCQVFNSQIQLEENLISTQKLVLDKLDAFLEAEASKLDDIKKQLDSTLVKVNSWWREDEGIFENPLNAFKILKHLTVDLDHLIKFSRKKSNLASLERSMKSIKKRALFSSSQQDLRGAAKAIQRLQETYHLNTDDLVRGEVAGHQYPLKLTYEDCFLLGQQLYFSNFYGYDLVWLNKSLELYDNEHQLLKHKTFYYPSSSVSKADIIYYLGKSYSKRGWLNHSVKYLKEVLEINPKYPNASIDLENYEKELEIPNFRRPGLEITLDELSVRNDLQRAKGVWKKDYESACRGERKKYQPGLVCNYKNNDPYLKIGPFKREVLHRNPQVFLYHDVIFDSEMETLKKVAKKNFRTAFTILFNETDARVGKIAWVDGHRHNKTKNIDKRIEKITGLTMKTAEALQIVNYGLGGHYESHVDYFRNEAEIEATNYLGTGNRIATFLIYLNDVKSGGSTVFPDLKLKLDPVKGAAVFWWNLLRDGTGDQSTIHAGCPVILGTKWGKIKVKKFLKNLSQNLYLGVNKWIHEYGQEFRRPCKLTPSKILFQKKHWEKFF